jgi:hypothetical protein
VWAEGGVLVDRSRQLLWVFGGEDLRWKAPLRRLYLQLLAEVWTGWNVQWAYSGIADLIEQVGGNYEYVDEDTPNTNEADILRHPEEKGWTDYVGSSYFQITL